MKLMPVKINESIDHILNFESRSQTIREFVVQSDGSTAVLLTFYPQKSNDDSDDKKYIFHTDRVKGEAALSNIEVMKAEGPYKKDDCVDVDVNIQFKFCAEHTSEDTDASENIDASENTDSKKIETRGWDSETHTLSLDIDNVDNVPLCYRVKVQVAVDLDGNDYRQSFIVNVAPKENIYDAVLDFGSEASQILLFCRRNGRIVNELFPIYSCFKALMGDHNDEDNNVLQYEARNPYLYKSHFFVPKSIDVDKSYDPANVSRETEILKQYTLLSDLDKIRSEYVTLPNVKIAAHGGVNTSLVTSQTNQIVSLRNFQNNYFYRASVNSFVYHILNAVAGDTQAPKVRFIVLYALVPNVYIQSEVSDYLNYLRQDVEKMLSDNQNLKAAIKGISISSVSESDASFLGFLSSLPDAANAIPAGEYLIMDAGKGTLDFSVIEYDPDKKPCVKGLFRSGIAGAGNAITYAFLLAILNQLFNRIEIQEERENAIREFIEQKVHKGDESQIHKMVNLLETFKKKYNDGKLTNEWTGTVTNASDLELEGLINSINHNLEHNGNLEDYSFVDAMIEQIADNALKRLSYRGHNSFKSVVFTGRGFRMNKLREVMLEKLKTLNGCEELTEISLDERRASMKNVCLFGLSYLNDGSYDGLMVGVPDILHHGDKILTPHKETVEKKVKPKKKEKVLLSKLRKWQPTLHELIIRKMGEMPSNNDEQLIKIDNNYINGVHLDATTAEDRIMISGNFYRISRLKSGSLEVFFDGDDFWVEQRGRRLPISPIVDVEKRMAYESMFPYAGYLEEDIPIPHLRRADGENPSTENEDVVETEDMTDEELAEKLKKN